MRKARLHLTVDVPIGEDFIYPPDVTTDEQRARFEYLLLLASPEEYFEYTVRKGPGWIACSGYRFVDEEIPGDDRIE